MVRRKNGSGMTLLEVLVALLVSTVGLLGALAMLGTILGGGQFSRNSTEASILAQDKLEELVIMPGVTASNPPDNTIITELNINAFGRTPAPPDGTGIYTRQTTWGTDPVATFGVRRTITVVVSWLDALGRPHAITAQRERST